MSVCISFSGCLTKCQGSPRLRSYLALTDTVNVLFDGLVSVPLNVADPVADNVPACIAVKPTVTVSVAPPAKSPREHLRVPPDWPGVIPVQDA